MNKQIITLIVVAVAAMAVGYFIGTGTSSGVKPESQITMKNQTDSLNYFLGLNWGYSLEEAPWEPDADLLASGLLQVLTDTSSFDPMTAQNIFRDLSMALSEVEQKSTIAPFSKAIFIMLLVPIEFERAVSTGNS